MPSPSSILSFGTDRILVETRQQIFQAAGFTSRKADSLDELYRSFQHDLIDLLVICHTASPAVREEAKYLAYNQPAPALVLVLNQGRGAFADKADDSFDSLEGPAKLLRTVHALLKTHDRNYS